MTLQPQSILDNTKMNSFQIMAVAICIFLNALDGFDVLAISFASPGIAAEWQVSRATLGVVLSMELIGMAIGSISLGGLADRFGRRPTILGCLTVMAVGMYFSALATGITWLCIVRFITGLGIGGMLASVTAMVSEYSNRRYRNLCVSLMAAGYPTGAVLGGTVASALLTTFDWRAVFIFGSIITAAALVITFLFLPESIDNLVSRRPEGALDKINHTLRRMGHQTLDELPAVTNHHTKEAGFSDLFKPGIASVTIILTLAYFAHIMTFYYLAKWIPKLVVDMGFSSSLAGSVLVWTNVGGATGSILAGLIALKIDQKKLTIGILLLSFLAVTLFGAGQGSLATLSLVAAIAGFFTTSGITSLYALFTQYFPASIRASGTGFAIGVGRGGAALGPIIAGFLFAGGISVFTVSLLMATGALIGAFILIFLPAKTTDSLG